MKKIIFLCICFTQFTHADYIRNSGIVTDSETTLQWQDTYNANGMQIRESNWLDAINYCENLSLGIYVDWRLPSITELESIIDYGRKNPAIQIIFERIYENENNLFWSSSTLMGISSNVWVVYFKNGRQFNMFKTNSAYVRCVRAGQ